MTTTPIVRRVLRKKAREWVRAEGRMEGKAEGEREKALEIAKNFLADGVPPEVVARNTELSMDDIRSL